MSEEKTVPNSETPVRRFEYKSPPAGIPSVYSNNIQLQQTVYDLRIVFGEVGSVTPEVAEVHQRVSVTMSWLEAKILSEFLSSYVRSFEEQNGPIQTSFVGVKNPPAPNLPKMTGTASSGPSV